MGTSPEKESCLKICYLPSAKHSNRNGSRDSINAGWIWAVSPRPKLQANYLWGVPYSQTEVVTTSSQADNPRVGPTWPGAVTWPVLCTQGVQAWEKHDSEDNLSEKLLQWIPEPEKTSDSFLFSAINTTALFRNDRKFRFFLLDSPRNPFSLSQG